MTRLIDMADPARGDDPNEFQGYHYDASVSFIMVEASPGSGPKLHKHPYEEIFVAHKFVNTGAGRLRQVDIHASGRYITEWLEV